MALRVVKLSALDVGLCERFFSVAIGFVALLYWAFFGVFSCVKGACSWLVLVGCAI